MYRTFMRRTRNFHVNRKKLFFHAGLMFNVYAQERKVVLLSRRSTRNWQGISENMMSHTEQPQQDRHLKLAVGTASDPGITRKHKPNEDSLFAIQGTQT